MDEGVSGFEVRGDWTDIVEHGEQITEALREAGADGDAFEAWESWRPKAVERIDEEMSRKTASEASIGEGPGERADVSAGEDLRRASEKLSEGYADLRDDGIGEARGSLGESIGHAGRAADTAGRRATRAVEEALYEDVVTMVSPYYFDNDLVSANLREKGDGYAFEVDINDDDLKAAVSETLDEQDAEGWRIEVEPETASVEATTGADLSGRSA